MLCSIHLEATMARYKDTDIDSGQGLFLAVNLKEQLLPGTFEHMLDELIGSKIDISDFDANYKNDETGSKAIPPAVLVKLIIYGYSKGIKSSRKIFELCKWNIIAKALSGGMEPHWTTIADFISSNSAIFKNIFVEVLTYCAELGLVGGHTFAIDGVRLPSNASIELSGTKAELERRLNVYRKMAGKHIAKHQRQDEREELNKETEKNYQKRQKKLNRQISKINNFLAVMKQKGGKQREEIKSNVTDNDSAMIRSSDGFIQGYIGIAVSDDLNQIIVSAEAVGSSNEGEHFSQLLDETLSNVKEVGIKPTEGKKLIILADNNYFSENNLKVCQERKIEAIIPDGQYKKRLGGTEKSKYDSDDFKYYEESNYYECPNGKKLKYKRVVVLRGQEWMRYQASVKDCRICPFNTRCINAKEDINKTSHGKMILIKKSSEHGNLCREMREKLNTLECQDIYANRIQIIEPVFANIKYCMGLNRFTLRSKEKVNGQWNLYCIVHNLSKCLKSYNLNMGYT